MTLKILKICFYLLFLLTPLIFTKFTSELFEYNKMMFVYALTIIISGTWIIRMISEKQLIFKHTPLDIPIALFLLSQIISTFISIDVHTSIWGYYSRSNGGLLSILSYIALYYAFVSNFGKDSVLKFLNAAIVSGVLVSLYSIPEHFGLSPSCVLLTGEYSANCWVQDVQARVFGTIGQPNWLAAYLAMLIFPAIYFLIKAKSKLHFILYFAAACLMYLSFTYTYSRGATLGLIAGAGVMIAGLAAPFIFKSSKKSASSNLIPIKIFAIIALTFITINIYFGSAISTFKLESSDIASRPSIIQQQAPSGTQLENGGTESGQIRLIVWKGALEIFKAYPIFGSGVETFAYAYYLYRPMEHNNVSEWDFLYNKAHNEYLNYLATTGAFGFLTYMAVIIAFIILSLKYALFSKDKSQKDTDFLLPAALLAGYVSYLIQNFFLFSVVNVSLLFYLFPAFLLVYLEKTKELSEKNPLHRLFSLMGRNNISQNLTSGLVVIIIIAGLSSLYTLWSADTNYKKGSDYNDLNNPGRAYTYLVQAVKMNPNEPLYLAELGNAAGSSSVALASKESSESAETAIQLKDDAQFFTDLALKISPMNTSINRTAIRTYFSLSLLDPALEPKTLSILDAAIALSPTDPKLLHNKGIILTQYGSFDEAAEVFNKAIAMKPNYRDARLSLAGLYIETGKKDLAQKEINAVLKLIPGDADALKLQDEIK